MSVSDDIGTGSSFAKPTIIFCFSRETRIFRALLVGDERSSLWKAEEEAELPQSPSVVTVVDSPAAMATDITSLGRACELTLVGKLVVVVVVAAAVAR